MKEAFHRRAAAVLLTGMVLLFAAGCATTDAVSGKRVRNLYSIDEDIQMGESFYANIRQQMQERGVPVDADRDKVGMLRGMVDRISAVSHMPDLPYEVTLFETGIVNAAAAPGGKIIVFSGLYHPRIGLARNEDEIAAVIAHEIAHVTCRHTTESLTARFLPDLLLLAGALYAEVEEEEELALALSAAFIAYEGLLLPRYSRRDEEEADAVGMMYMAQAGYDPRAAPAIWRRAHEREGKTPLLDTWLSSHPSNEKRYEQLMELLPRALEVYEQARRHP